MNTLERKIIELSYKHQLSHISSCLNCVNLLDWIYDERQRINTTVDEPVCLDNSHAALALYVVLEKHGLCDAEEMIRTHGTHAGRDLEHGIYISGGSLGQVATVAVGLALADKERRVWLVTSDGAAMEGCVSEALRFAGKHCLNLLTHIVFNGYGAYGEISHGDLPTDAKIYYVDALRYPKWLRGLDGHYLKLSESRYQELMA